MYHVQSIKTYLTCNLEERAGAGSLVQLAVSLGRSTGNTVVEAELDVGVDVLLNVNTLNLGGRNNSSIDDPDGALAGTVAGSKISIHLVNSTVEGNVTVLLVHVVGTRTRVVTDLDTVVLNMNSLLLEDLVNSKNLTNGRLGLVKHGKEVPETRHGNRLVSSKELHAEDLGVGVLGSRLVATNDLVQVVDKRGHLK